MVKIDRAEYLPLLMFMLIPFAWVSRGLIHYAQHLFFIISAMVIMGSMLYKSKPDGIAVKSLSWLIFLLYLSFWQFILFISVMLFPGRIDFMFTLSLQEFLFILCGAVVFCAVVKSNLSDKTFYNAICISALLQVFVGAFQIFNIDLMGILISPIVPVDYQLDKGSTSGTLGNNNFLSAWLAISLPFFFRKFWKWFIPIIIAMLFFANTRAGIIAALISGAYFFWVDVLVFFTIGRWRLLKLLAGTIVAWALAFIFTLSVKMSSYTNTCSSIKERYDYWWDAIVRTCATPTSFLFGFGPGFPWKKFGSLHSEYVQMFFNYGYIGIALLFLYIIYLFRNTYSRILTASLISIILLISVSYLMRLAPSAFLILIVCGLIEREIALNSKGGIKHETISKTL